MEEITKFDEKFYGRIKTRSLTSRQEMLHKTLMPEIEIKAFDDINVSDFAHTFLEIGFGSGEHIAQMAMNNPNDLFIGCEPFVNGVVSLLVAIILVQFIYPRISLISISITSAIVHNIVQVLVFCLLVNNMYMISYLPYFALIGAASGLIVGALVYLVIHKVPLSFFEKIINNEKYIVKEKV